MKILQVFTFVLFLLVATLPATTTQSVLNTDATGQTSPPPWAQ
jgi:hypothetical protein